MPKPRVQANGASFLVCSTGILQQNITAQIRLKPKKLLKTWKKRCTGDVSSIRIAELFSLSNFSNAFF
jgi:hypothetical protein